MAMKTASVTAIFAIAGMTACATVDSGAVIAGTRQDREFDKLMREFQESPDQNSRIINASSLAFWARTQSDSQMNELSCSRVERIINEITIQPPEVKAYFVMITGDIGGRARFALPIMRSALVEAEAALQPGRFGMYPAVEFTSEIRDAIRKVENGDDSGACE